MKVKGPDRSKNTDKAKKKESTKTGDSTFGDMISGASQQSDGAASARSLTQVDALLAVQGAEDPTERASRGRMRERAGRILDELDAIRVSLLTGTLTVGQVINVADIVATHRERIMDPELTAILDEIDLRAQVEIAKMRVAMDKKS